MTRRSAVPSLPTRIAPLELLWDLAPGRRVPLPSSLSRFYGTLRLPHLSKRPCIVGNFASTLDGVVSLGRPGPSSGGEITGFDPQDRLLMGILRAVADAVVIGAGTLRAVPRHTWTADHVFPAAAPEFARIRQRLGQPPRPLNVVVSGSGRIDLRLPLFAAGEVPVLIVTTAAGARRLGPTGDYPSVRVATVRRSGALRAREVVRAVRARSPASVLLVEGGPHLVGSFLAERLLDELFLTLAPQVAGRDRTARPGLVAGRSFAPEDPRWGTLTGVRRGRRMLFLRFGFDPGAGQAVSSVGRREV